MTLLQLFDQVNKKQNFYRDEDEVWDAISSAARALYLEILKETTSGGQMGSGGGGFFLTFDTTSVALAANTEEYALPAQLSKLVRVRERLLATDPWRRVNNADLNAAPFLDAAFATASGADQSGPVSDFLFTGPYLTLVDAETAAQQYRIRLAPIPQDARQVELVYVAEFVEIAGPESFNIIPAEGHNLLKYLAISECLGAEDDDNEYFLGRIAAERPLFFDWVRSRQVSNARTVEPYIEDMD